MIKKLSPAQQQYMDLKSDHEDCLLFFRLWDFYEVFYDDAHICHKVLSITLTARNKNAPDPIPMAWIPHHALEKYLPKLIEAGYKVALAEQIGIPEKGKIVERKVTQIITPSTYVSTQVTEKILVWVSCKDEEFHLARWDVTLWMFSTYSVSSFGDLCQYLLSLRPVEVVVDVHIPEKNTLCDWIREELQVPFSYAETPHDTIQFLQQQLRVSTLEWYGRVFWSWRWEAFSLLVLYFIQTQKTSLWTIHSLTYALSDDRVTLDPITIKNLELFSSSYEWSKKHSLYWVIDTCRTSPWKRLLKSRLSQPTSNMQILSSRLSAISYFVDENEIRNEFLSVFADVWDLSRQLYQNVYKKPSARRLQNFSSQLQVILSNDHIVVCLKKFELLSFDEINLCKELTAYLTSMLNVDLVSDEKWYISAWIDEQLDELRAVAYHSDDLLLTYQQELVRESWISNIKIKFIKNQWYSLEVTPKDRDLFEKMIDAEDSNKDFVRTQSLKWWQRYSSTYLSELQERILSAQEQVVVYEKKILTEIVSRTSSESEVLYRFIDGVAFLDLVSSFAELSIKNSYSCPEFSEWWWIDIRDWKHPVVEHFLDHNSSFIPNDMLFSSDEFCHLITWPNMWGKSTYLRQNALIVLMAHAWLYVPASYAKIRLVDWIFARVWSWDLLAKNQSTFMTEMIEMAYILHHATENSFIILDELWRWTSTYDWLSLAKSIVVYLCQEVKANILFATHYHELLELEASLTWCSNWSLQVYEDGDDVVFMKKIVPWWVSKSYGLDVARLAGIPASVLDLARKELAQLETLRSERVLAPSDGGVQTWFWSPRHSDTREKQSAILDLSEQELSLRDEIRWLNLDNITPIQAFQRLCEKKWDFDPSNEKAM